MNVCSSLAEHTGFVFNQVPEDMRSSSLGHA